MFLLLKVLTCVTPYEMLVQTLLLLWNVNMNRPITTRSMETVYKVP